MTKIKSLICTAILATLFTFNISKAEEIYFGIDFLNNEIDTGVTNISSSLDEKDSGYSLYGGIPLNENLAVEISYQDFGEASLSGVNGNQFRIGTTTYQFTTTASLSVSADTHLFQKCQLVKTFHYTENLAFIIGIVNFLLLQQTQQHL